MMQQVQVDVQGVFAEVTRYPLDILDPQANLEEELGIDSVKLGEVFSVLRERFHLPQELNIPRERLATIRGLSEALTDYIGKNGKNGHTKAAPANGAAAPAIDLAAQIKAVFAEVTRYPLEILDADAALEEELGVDSVKLGEVLSVLRARFSLPPDLVVPRENLRTISAISTVLQRYVALPAAKANGNGNGHHVNGATLPKASARTSSDQDLTGAIRNVFAEVTRYPIEILDPDAGLEEELGIDSVKLGEVFSVLRERYALPAELGLSRESLGTIAGIAAALRTHLAAHTAGSSLPAPPPTESAEALVIAVFAEVTRYPREILDPTADLEGDLGIDSVKLGEVVSVLLERYPLPGNISLPKEKLSSIREITAKLAPYMAAPAPVVSAIAPAPAIRAGTAKANGNGSHAALYAYEKPASKPFTGKVVFISGSGRGLGKDISLYLADLGASVVVNSFHSRAKGEQTAEEIRKNGGDAVHVWGSMANPEHVGRVFDEIEAHYGHLDFFIGNASNGMLAKLEDLTVEHWEKAYRTNVIGLHQSALRAVKLMRKRGGGKIVTLSSPASQGYVDYFGCMGTVKAAVESLTRSMAIEFAKYNIQVNCVSPGPVYGELLDKWPESERLVRQWESNTAYGKLCEARDVSHFIAYLLSEPVKLFTGSVLIMDGGISSQGW